MITFIIQRDASMIQTKTPTKMNIFTLHPAHLVTMEIIRDVVNLGKNHKTNTDDVNSNYTITQNDDIFCKTFSHIQTYFKKI